MAGLKPLKISTSVSLPDLWLLPLLLPLLLVVVLLLLLAWFV